MHISELSVKRPVSTVMLILIVVLLGVVSFTRLSIDLYPDIEIPVAVVTTSYPNVGPEEVEKLITQPLEEAIGTIQNIDTLQSVTSEGNSLIIVLFDFGTDMDFSTLKMREQVDMIKGYLPDGAEDPMVMQFDINALPIMEITLTGADLAKLQNYAEDELKSALERIDGVASVAITGGFDEYISIKLDMEKLIGYGLSVDSIQQVLAAENINLPAGSVNKGDKKLLVRTVGEFEDVKEIENISIILNNGSVIRLSDVAEITKENEELSAISKVNGEPAVNLSIQKQSGKNTVQVATDVAKVIGNYNKRTDYQVDIVLDQSEYIRDSINQVSNNAIAGGLLAIFVLLVFLRNFRSTLIIALTIPISIIATFVLIYFNGITLNMMTLGGLALGVGMLVDNSVVVLENIYRFRQEGLSRRKAAVSGAKEVALSVTASTLTTIAVFLPMVFVQGMTAIMFRELSLTVTFSLLSSLVVSLTLIPMLSSKLLKVDQMQGKHHVNKFKLIGGFLDQTDKVYFFIEAEYKKLLAGALKHRVTVVIVAIVVFAASMFSVTMVGAEFMPVTDEGQIAINIELEAGAVAEDTSAKIDEVIALIEDIPEIDTLFSETGSGQMFDTVQNVGAIQGILVPLRERERSSEEVAREVARSVKDVTGVKITAAASSNSMGGGPSSSPVEIIVSGKEFDELSRISDELITGLAEIEGTINIESNLSDTISQVEIDIDQQKASTYGLTTYQVANTVKALVSGRIATTFKVDGDELDVVIEGNDLYEESISNYKQLLIQSPTGVEVPLDVIADISVQDGYTSLYRENNVRSATITSDISGRDLRSIVQDVTAYLDSYKFPTGYTYDIGGENEDMVEAFKDLALALGIAILLVYMILASQFESLLMPFIIMFSTPFALSGGMLGLFITDRTLSVTSIVGFIMLSGIVVNNAIVLIDYINTRRENGEDRTTAILKAGPIRLRPIMMTTMTTVLAMVPLGLGIGEGAELQAPMATVIIFGLTLSTLLTLVFIPVLYTIVDDRRKKK